MDTLKGDEMAALTGVEAARAMQAKWNRMQEAAEYAVESGGAFRVFSDLAKAEAFAERVGSTVVRV